MDLVVSLVVLSLLIAIKIGGVWAAARAFGPKLFPAVRPSPLRVALLRFALGLVGSGVALAVGAALSNMLMSANRAATGTVVGLGAQLALRVVAWLVVVRVFYDRAFADRRSVAIAALGGTALSYLLDVPNAILAIGNFVWLLRDVSFC